MLLKTLLQNVVKYIENNPVDTGAIIIKMKCAQVDKPVDQIVMGLDARAIGILRSLVPNAFPRKLRQGELTVEKNSIGTWRVTRSETAHG